MFHPALRPRPEGGGEFRQQLTSNSKRFILNWNNNQLGTVGVIQPTLPACKVETLSRNVTGVSYIPPHTRGDSDFDGNGPKVDASVDLFTNATSISARVCMKAQETQDDWTTAQGCTVAPLYTIDPGWKIQQLVGSLSDQFS